MNKYNKKNFSLYSNLVIGFNQSSMLRIVTMSVKQLFHLPKELTGNISDQFFLIFKLTNT